MNSRYDAVIIGAGVIGAGIAFGLAKRGWKTLNIDKQPAAGYGSTANSCAVIRTHYSTLQGTALAWENIFAWKDWGGFLGVEDELGWAQYRPTGILVLKQHEAEYEPFREHHRALGAVPAPGRGSRVLRIWVLSAVAALATGETGDSPPTLLAGGPRRSYLRSCPEAGPE